MIGAVDAATGEPFAVEGNAADGSIRVDVRSLPSSLVTVAGDNTPSDSYPNPADAIDAFALLGGWDAASGQWRRVQVQFANDNILPNNAINVSSFAMALNANAGQWQRVRAKAWGTSPGVDVLSSASGNLTTIGQLVGPDGSGGYRVARVNSVGALAVGGVVTGGPAGYALATYQAACLNERGGLFTTYRRPTAGTNDQWSLSRAQNVNAASMVGAAHSMLSFRVSNDTGASVRVAFVNKASAPINGDTIALGPYVVRDGETLSIGDRELGPNGWYFTTGCAMAVVTTVGAPLVTLAGAPTGLLVEVEGVS